MVPVATPEELKPLEREFGELLAKQKGYWWIPVFDYLFFLGFVVTVAKYGLNLITVPPLILVALFITWMGYPKGDIEARLKDIRKTFEAHGFLIANESNLKVRVYKKHL